MIKTTGFFIPLEQVGFTPFMYWIMNRLKTQDTDLDTIFIHKRVEYDGTLCLMEGSSALVRICIVQPKQGGESRFGNRANTFAIFGTGEPTIASRISEDWIAISDRHFLLDTTNPEIPISYSHRLSHNMSLQEKLPLAPYTFVKSGPLYWFAFTDTHNAIGFKNLTLRTLGFTDTIEHL